MTQPQTTTSQCNYTSLALERSISIIRKTKVSKIHWCLVFDLLQNIVNWLMELCAILIHVKLEMMIAIKGQRVGLLVNISIRLHRCSATRKMQCCVLLTTKGGSKKKWWLPYMFLQPQPQDNSYLGPTALSQFQQQQPKQNRQQKRWQQSWTCPWEKMNEMKE